MTAKYSRLLIWLPWGAIFLVFVLDRFIKYFWVRSDSFFTKDYINEFISFDIKIPTVVIYTVTFVILSWLFYELVKNLKRKNNMPAILFLGVFMGGVSNVIDRLLYGGVVDYISFSPLVNFFPVFNISDVLISLSVVGLGLYYIKKSSYAKHN